MHRYFDYDAASRITRITDIDGATDYSYDKTNQLTAADATYRPDEGYSYDANGNRTNAGYQAGSNNQLTSDGIYTYTYDDEGNLKTRTKIGTSEVRTFTWDYRNRLVGVSDSNGNVTTYTYDVMDRRIAKTVNGTSTQFVYDGDNIILEFNGTATPSVRYLQGLGVDQVLAQETGNSVSWMLTDHLGTIRDLVNNAGSVVNHLTYDSFGKVLTSTPGGIDTRYKFTGRELDAETGLHYYRARYFDANTGRFIGQDPIGFSAGDSNLYRYVGNSPLMATDPSGRFKVELRYRGVNGVHADIVVSDKYGKRSYWGGPENKVFEALPFGPLRLSGLSGGTGKIVADREPSYKQGFKYYIPDNRLDRIQQIYFDKSTCPNKALENKIWTSLLRIESANIPYKLLSTNSNSAAFHTLREIGLGGNPKPKRYAPGWDINPFTRKIDPRAYSVGGIRTPNTYGDTYSPVGPPTLYKGK